MKKSLFFLIVFLFLTAVFPGCKDDEEEPALQDDDSLLETTVYEKPPVRFTTAEGEFKSMFSGPNILYPETDVRIRLYAATSEGKPDYGPLDLIDTSGFTGGKSFFPDLDGIEDFFRPKDPFYSAARNGIFIDEETDEVRWFAYILTDSVDAEKVVWQVSVRPFPVAGRTDWKTLPGLKKSGEVDAKAGEFSIDFGDLGFQYTVGKPIPMARRTYYVRAVPVDGAGNAVGDPGTGMSVVYGKRSANPFGSREAAPSFEVWTPAANLPECRTGAAKAGPVECFYPEKLEEAFVAPIGAPITTGSGGYSTYETSSTRLFSLMKTDPDAFKVIIQVSEYDFAPWDTWPDKKNLVYEETCKMPIDLNALEYPAGTNHLTAEELEDNGFMNTVLVDFSKFGKPVSEMTATEYICYYVRAISLKKSGMPGIVDAAYSQTVKILYGYEKPDDIILKNPPQPERAPAATPGIRIKSYTPVQWESNDSRHWYYVFKEPKCHDIRCNYKNRDGEVLVPFTVHNLLYDPDLTETEYENRISKFLKVGYSVYFPPATPETKSWWEDLWDSVLGFFSDLIGFLEDIYNKVKAAYDSIKSGLINFVADMLPVGEPFQSAFKTALGALVDTGLMAAGVPPDIPNFDELVKGNVAYLTEVALTEAGVPAAGVIAETAAEHGPEIAKAIGDQIAAGANTPDPNPGNEPFLKLHPLYQYRPACVELEVYNDTQYPSVPGTLNLSVTFEFDYSNYVSADPKKFLEIGNDPKYTKHFLYELNAYTLDIFKGHTVVYDVFMQMEGIKVPMLAKMESRVIKLYLFPYGSGESRYYAAEPNIYKNIQNAMTVDMKDFYIMYIKNGDKNMTYFNVSFTPGMSVQEFFDKYLNTLYMPKNPEAEIAFAEGGKQEDLRKQRPVNVDWDH